MELYSSNKDYKLYHGNILDMLEVIEPNTIDSVITDPPYGLTSITKRFGKENSAEVKDTKGGFFKRLDKGFMGKEWDGSGIEYNVNAWRKCYEVLKPGGYLLAFGGSRTFHRIACAIEDAGFEIRDTIMWLYGSGFPKSMNIGLAIDKKNGVESKVVGEIKTHDFSKHKGSMMSFANTKEQETSISNVKIKQAQNKWQGWGTALKPSFEPIIVARKPFKGSLVDNVIEYGVGGINIDECRVETNDNLKECISSGSNGLGEMIRGHKYIPNEIGRFPANTIMTYNIDDYKEVCSGFKTKEDEYNARYFYCAKASKKDRDEGLDNRKEVKVNDGRNTPIDNAFQRGETLRKNTHPTVKPTELMQYLIRLVSPNGATILDPFNGSGSTGKAVMYENKERNSNYKYIGIELTEEYLPISKARIECLIDITPEEPKEDIPAGQTSIFDFIGESND